MKCAIAQGASILTLLFVALGTAAAEQIQIQTIAGPLPKTVKAGTYLVNADIEVSRNRIVTIEEGTVFLFKNFTSLHVQGTLVANGTKAQPIIFTSEYDKDYNRASTQDANPFDWDGVYIHADALATRLFYCKVLYSVYGLISETKFIRLEPGIFLYNGKSNLIIDGKEQSESGGQGQYLYVLSTKDATVDGVPVKLLEDPLAPKRNWLRWGGLAVFLGGTAATVYQATQISQTQKDLDAVSAKTLANLNSHNSEDWKTALKYRNKNIYLTIPGAVCIGAGAFCFTWSFTF